MEVSDVFLPHHPKQLQVVLPLNSQFLQEAPISTCLLMPVVSTILNMADSKADRVLTRSPE